MDRPRPHGPSCLGRGTPRALAAHSRAVSQLFTFQGWKALRRSTPLSDSLNWQGGKCNRYPGRVKPLSPVLVRFLAQPHVLQVFVAFDVSRLRVIVIPRIALSFYEHQVRSHPWSLRRRPGTRGDRFGSTTVRRPLLLPPSRRHTASTLGPDRGLPSMIQRTVPLGPGPTRRRS